MQATVDDAALCDALQKETFGYFLNECNATTGLIADKTAPGWPSSIAAVGLALSAFPVGVERRFLDREEAVRRVATTLEFLWNAPQGEEPDASGNRGFFYHFLDMETGRRAWRSELSTVDSAFLVAGALAAAVYFDGPSEPERRIRDLARRIWERVDWEWALNGGLTLTHGWKPESGFLPYRWQGYDEALLLYVLALASPTHPIPAGSYAAWATTYSWKRIYGQEYFYSGPLFTHQLSHVWIDFRKIQDAPMRERGIDYFENSRRATLVHQQYAIRNPLGHALYGECCWGSHGLRRPGQRLARRGRRRTVFLRLHRARRPVRAGRRDDRAVVGRRVAPVRARDRAADDSVLRREGPPQEPSLWFRGDVQRDIPVQTRRPPRLGLAVDLRPEPGSHRPDDREPSVRILLGPDETLSPYPRGIAPRRVQRRLAVGRRPKCHDDREGTRAVIRSNRPTVLAESCAGKAGSPCVKRAPESRVSGTNRA